MQLWAAREIDGLRLLSGTEVLLLRRVAKPRLSAGRSAAAALLSYASDIEFVARAAAAEAAHGRLLEQSGSSHRAVRSVISVFFLLFLTEYLANLICINILLLLVRSVW